MGRKDWTLLNAVSGPGYDGWLRLHGCLAWLVCGLLLPPSLFVEGRGEGWVFVHWGNLKKRNRWPGWMEEGWDGSGIR